MIRTRFDATDEFLDDLKKDVREVEGMIVRVTCTGIRDQPLTQIYVTVTTIVRGRLVTLRRRVGSYLQGMNDEAKKIWEESEGHAAKIRGQLTEMGFDVRDGIYEVDEGKK